MKKLLFGEKTKKESTEKKKDKETAPSIPKSPHISKSFEIPLGELQFLDKKLGVGGFGSVKVAKWNGTEVAVKFIPRDSASSELTFKNEVALLADLHHPNVVQMYGYSANEDKFLMVLELVHGGDLQKLIHDHTKPLELPQIVEFILNISRGMIYLHKRNILHRDMKPGNILVTNAEFGQAKITDFGLSKATTDLTRTAHFGTPLYAAPELVQDNYTEKVDVFSFAIIMWEMFARILPYDKIKFASEVQEKVRGGHRPSPWPERCPEPYKKLISKCWSGTPSHRPSFDEIHDIVEKFKADLPNALTTSALVSQSSVSGLATNLNLQGPQSSSQHRTTSESKLETMSEVSVDSFSYSGMPGYLKRQTEHDCFIKAISAQEITWTSIVLQARQILFASTVHLNLIKFLFETNTHNNFISFVEYFAPLLPEKADEFESKIYESGQDDSTPTISSPGVQSLATNDNKDTEEGYRFSEIAAIVSQPFFHGFVSATDAKQMLDAAPKGTFIVRFSSNKKFYCLDVKDDNQVRHWRIERIGKAKLQLPGHTFPSLADIIKFYEKQPLVLQNGSLACCLGAPLQRRV
eukprot:TRINITY_DN9297_c0_g1_i1.p1 TRINITY_DN9297_c0_g1~~TRINITY_DN9297_c0_g1_i1.p1  ORF type:complete len:579 (-),score=136.63 TRINITY_DN9297_c0_g1_i1:52-1788(-)